jgi:hypothetical protein
MSYIGCSSILTLERRRATFSKSGTSEINCMDFVKIENVENNTLFGIINQAFDSKLSRYWLYLVQTEFDETLENHTCRRGSLRL